MSPYRSYCIPIVILFCICVQSVSYAQSYGVNKRYDEQINLICDYAFGSQNKFKSIESLVEGGADGFIFKLALNEDSTSIEVQNSGGSGKDLSIVCKQLDQICKQNSKTVFTIFFDYSFNTQILIDFLQQQECYRYIWKDLPSKEWPTIETLLLGYNQLVCFSLNQISENPMLKNFWDYGVQPCYSSDIQPKINGEFCRGDIKNKLLFIDNYTQYTSSLNYLDTNRDPFFVSHGINIWKNTGKKVNFIVFSRSRGHIKGLKHRFGNQKNITGTISYNREPLTRVFWEGNFNAVTNGNFCFPAVKNEEIVLEPSAMGFRFVPEKIEVESISKDIVQNFIAIPVDIQEGLAAYFPFTESISDESNNKYKVINNGAELKVDNKRNNVLQFDGNAYVTLPEASTLGISNSDFTISAWVKLARNTDEKQRDFSVMGTKENYYRGGLHLQIRNNKPYFGFFSNDVSGTTNLCANRWYHIVWRYNKYNQEQAIYVNGELDGASLNHPPFVSKSNLFIGRSISKDQLFEGSLDDIIIWNRALGENEIWNLYQGVSLMPESSFTFFLKKYGVVFGSILVVVLLLIFITRRVKKTPENKKSTEPSFLLIDEELQENNSISLFGEFRVINKNGLDITNSFTPRLKQIFIYLLLKSKNESHGVSSEDFIAEVWTGFDRKKAINNRGVSISKLRGLLNQLDEITIINHQERWRIELSENVYCDYYESLNYRKSNLFSDHLKLNRFLSIVHRGAFLFDSKDALFDEVKGAYSNKIIDVLVRLLSEFTLDQNPDLVIKIADRVLIVDDLNEEALKYKVKALLEMHQVNEARFLFKSFSERYSEVYNEDLPISYKSLVS
ncbi:LamG domain-containing protein [Saccharicrinis aurantiacus]|uniref:LamG domain-containing protein n=1 Tax=Saccharicrinis aurantiacus TaxID=1849719 RepID=UPI00249294B0|nr:LamG-like jellyroll fold domain-containing protein [Saccharicrinis aurantiacus]